MAQGNFWRSFYQGWNSGDNMYRRQEELARRRDIGKAAEVEQETESQYDPEQLAKLQDPLAQAGGEWDEATQSYKMGDGNSYAPRPAPKFENGGYTLPDGSRVEPKNTYRLNGQTRNTAFTPEEINDVRLQRMASVYDKYGDPEKAQSLRANAQQLKLGKVQYDNALREAEEAKNVKSLMSLHQKYASGGLSEEEFMSQLVDLTDPMNGDGVTHAYENNGDGTYRISQLRNNKYVGSQVVTPDAAFREALKYSSPKFYAQITGEEQNTRDFGLKKDVFKHNVEQDGVANQLARDKLQQDDRQFTMGLDWKTAQHNDEMGLKRDQLDALRQYYQGIVSNKQYLNPLQQYQLEQQMAFDTERQGIVQQLQEGKITEQEATRRVNLLSRKFGSGALKDPRESPFKSPKDALEYAAGMYGAEWEAMPRSKREEIMNGLLGGGKENPTVDDAPPAPMGKKGLSKPAVAKQPIRGQGIQQDTPVRLAPKQNAFGPDKAWFERGVTPSTIGQALPWASQDVISGIQSAPQSLPVPQVKQSDIAYYSQYPEMAIPYEIWAAMPPEKQMAHKGRIYNLPN